MPSVGWLILADGFAAAFVVSAFWSLRRRPAPRSRTGAIKIGSLEMAHVAPGVGSVASIAAAPELTDDDLRRERALGDEARRLDEARRAIVGLLAECDDALARALLDFRIGIYRAGQQASRWHAEGREACQVCAEHRAHDVGEASLPTPGRLPEPHLIVRSFRTDTPTTDIRPYTLRLWAHALLVS